MENKPSDTLEEQPACDGKGLPNTENGAAHPKENGSTTHNENVSSSRKENGNHLKTLNDLNGRIHDTESEEKDSVYKCGAFSRYPKWLQRFANPRSFLVAFCIQNIIGGAEFTFTLGATTSVEKHFQFSSGDIGLLVLLSEIAPIITSVLLSFLGGRGNRPKWLAIGLVIGSVGVFLNFSTFLMYPAPTLSESGLLGDRSKKFCNLQDVINFQYFNATSTSSTSSLISQSLEDETENIGSCHNSQNFAFFIWLIGYTCKALSGTLIYTVGAPYMDDGIPKNSSPLYFAISISVRVLGPAIGFALSAIAINTYVYPGKNYGIKPNDPRWIGAWWIGPFIFSILMFAYSFVMVLFPRKMPKISTIGDVERESSEAQRAIQKKTRDEELVRTSVVPKDDDIHTGLELTNGYIENGDSNILAVRESEHRHLNNDLEYRNSSQSDGHVVLPGEEVVANSISGRFIKKYLSEKQLDGLRDFIHAIKRLSKNPVVVYGALADFTALVAEAGLFFWLAKYQEHQFRVTKSTATLFAGLSSTLSLIMGVVGGGMWISKYRPLAKTVAYVMMNCGILYLLSLVGKMFISCDFQQDLPGILTTDKKSVELYRGCSSGCECDQKEFIPVCIRDGPISLTYFSPCHAGCPDNIAAMITSDDIETFYNCTCGSPHAAVTSGYCQDTCSGFIIYNAFTVIVKSFISVGAIGGTLISLRCVAVEDKAIALGVKATMISAALIVNPVIFGSLIDSACLVWEETCDGRGSCWFYNTDDFRYKLHGLPCIFIFFCVFFLYMVARNIGDLELVEDDSPASSSSPLFFTGPGEGRVSSIRRSLKKISSRFMGGEIARPSTHEKEISHSRPPGKEKDRSCSRSTEKEKDSFHSKSLEKNHERAHERTNQRVTENENGKLANGTDIGFSFVRDKSLLTEDSPLSDCVESILPARLLKTTGV